MKNKTYDVYFAGTIRGTITVDAENEHQAKIIASQTFSHKNVDRDDMDYTAYEINKKD